jgi:hypothetical protein
MLAAKESVMSRSVKLVEFQPGSDELKMWGQSENPGTELGLEGVRGGMGVVVTVARS